MHIALLFDSDNPKYRGIYGDRIRNGILSTGILQASGRHMKVKVGNVLLYHGAQSRADLPARVERTFFAEEWRLLDEFRVRAVGLHGSVFAWVIQNTDEATARRLNDALGADVAYLGMHQVNLAKPMHLVMYRNFMVARYRIIGDSCRVFYGIGDVPVEHESEREELRAVGFRDVQWEELGGHGSSFDEYDTPEHFERVSEFRRLVASVLPGGEDEADELVLLLEDLSPRHFATLGACARAVYAGTHEEDFAQAGLSARRYLEQLADALFPARNELVNGRSVTQDKYRNRLWAHIHSSIPDSDGAKEERVRQLGLRVDHLVDEVNGALHGAVDLRSFALLIAELALVSVALLQLDFEASRKPYFAYEPAIERFFRDALGIPSES